MEDRRSGWIKAAVVAVTLVLTTAVVVAVASRSSGTRNPIAVAATPLGHKKYIVFMADGILDSSNALFVGAEKFQRDVMDRSAADMAAYKKEAIAFFKERYGLDFSAGDATGGATMQFYALPAKANMRAYTISGESVPPTGWEVDDAGISVLAGPGGTLLRGSWGGNAGRWVPEGTGIIFGEYRIHIEADPARAPILFRYQSVTPVEFSNGTMPSFDCDLASPDFGNGRAFGAYSIVPRADGTVHFMERNVLTFT